METRDENKKCLLKENWGKRRKKAEKKKKDHFFKNGPFSVFACFDGKN